MKEKGIEIKIKGATRCAKSEDSVCHMNARFRRSEARGLVFDSPRLHHAFYRLNRRYMIIFTCHM